MISPALEQYENLVPATALLYKHTHALAMQLLLPTFLVSVCFAYTADLGISGAVIGRLKRLVLTALLLLFFGLRLAMSTTAGCCASCGWAAPA